MAPQKGKMVLSHQVRYKTRNCTTLLLYPIANTVSFLILFSLGKLLRILSEMRDKRRSRPYSKVNIKAAY